jgi:hypothetical protein
MSFGVILSNESSFLGLKYTFVVFTQTLKFWRWCIYIYRIGLVFVCFFNKNVQTILFSVASQKDWILSNTDAGVYQCATFTITSKTFYLG